MANAEALAQELTEAILAGMQPAEMTAETLTRGERGLVWSADWASRVC